MRDRVAKVFFLTRLEGHVLSELLQAFGLSVGALTLVSIIGGAYGPVSDGLPLLVTLKFIPLVVPHMLPWTIPTAFVAACLMVYGRLSSANELTAVRASGVHLWRVFAPAAMVAAFLCVLCGLLNHHVVPRTRFVQYEILKGASASEQAAAIRYSDPVMSVGGHKVYLRELEMDDTFRDVVIVMREKTVASADTDRSLDLYKYVRAPRGHFEYSDDRGEIVFYLESDPVRSTLADPDAGKAVMYKVMGGTTRNFEYALFRKCVIPVKLRSASDLDFMPEKAKHLTTSQLMVRIARRLERMGAGYRTPPDTRGLSRDQKAYQLKKWGKWVSEPRQWQTTIHKRAALALATLLLGAIAAPLGVLIPRGRRVVAFAVAIAMTFLYYGLMAGAWKLGSAGVLMPGVAIWGVTALVGGVGLVLNVNLLKR